MSRQIASFPPRLLVSVRDAGEATLAVRAGADLVDAKDPSVGALGALPVAAVRAIRAAVGGRAVTSAVAHGPDAVSAMAATGVDYVKLGLIPGAWADEAALTRAAAGAPGRLIAVLFAEDHPPPGLPADLARAGFRGAMIDTAVKDGRRLADHVAGDELAAFVAACRACGLLCGLAGSLRIADIPGLAAHRPDYLGFRGGLCGGGDRRTGIDPLQVAEAVAALAALPDRDAA